MASRRWFYMIPATGEPRGLVHAIERHNLDGLPGAKTPYAGRVQLEVGAENAAVGDASRLRWNIRRSARFRTSRAWTRAPSSWCAAQGVDVVSSGDLVQQFEAHWSDAAIASHKAAAEKLYRVKDRAFEAAASAAARRRSPRPSSICSS